MKCILHPTDFSDNARQALRSAAKTAQLSAAKLIVCNVSEMPVLLDGYHEISFQGLQEHEKAYIEDMLEEWTLKSLTTIQKKELNIEFVALKDAFIGQAILKFAIRSQADLLVVGTRGRSRIKEVLFGSTTFELVRNSVVPVLAVPFGATTNRLKKILYATDLDPRDSAALKQLKNIAEIFNATIIAAHVLKDSQEVQEVKNMFAGYMQYMRNYPKVELAILPSGDVYQRLAEYITKHHIGMVAMLERGRGVISRITKKDRVMEMEFNSTIPVLTFNENYLV